jgi:hypothetical protein
LKLAVISYPDAVRDEDILAEDAVCSDYSAGAYVTEVPYFAVLPYLRALIHVAAWM